MPKPKDYGEIIKITHFTDANDNTVNKDQLPATFKMHGTNGQPSTRTVDGHISDGNHPPNLVTFDPTASSQGTNWWLKFELGGHPGESLGAHAYDPNDSNEHDHESVARASTREDVQAPKLEGCGRLMIITPRENQDVPLNFAASGTIDVLSGSPTDVSTKKYEPVTARVVPDKEHQMPGKSAKAVTTSGNRWFALFELPPAFSGKSCSLVVRTHSGCSMTRIRIDVQ